MPCHKSLATFAGLTAMVLSVTVPGWAKDEKPANEPTKRQQIQQQVQQRIQSNAGQSGGSQKQTQPPKTTNTNPGGGTVRNQLPQPPQQPRQLPQQSGNSSNNFGQGTLRNLPNRGSQSGNDTQPPKLTLPNPGNSPFGQPAGRDKLNVDPNQGSIRNRFPNAGNQNLQSGQAFNNDGDAEQQLRQKLKKQAEDMQKQGKGAGGGQPGPNINRDALKEKIETRKPPTTTPGGKLGGNLPSNADQARDRLKNAQDQLKNRPQGGQLPGQGNLPNLGNKLPGAGGNLPGGKLPGGNLPGVGGGLKDRIDLGKTGRPTTPLKIDKNGALGAFKDHPELKDAFDHTKIRKPEDLKGGFDRFENSAALQAHLKQSNLKVTDLSGAFQTKLKHNDVTLQHLGQTNFGKQININQQFNLAVNGDVARQMNLNQVLINNGGWAKRAYLGPVHPGYTKAAYSAWYAGPGFYPAYCWMPAWSPWVSWTFWNHCLPIYDPRPFWCRPIYWYDPCPPFVVYPYPVWQPLPVVTCGTWVDVPQTFVDTGFDVQLLAVRFVDPGHKEENLGPRYRVWVRNNSRAAIGAPFNVTLVAANGPELENDFQQAGVTMPNMDEGAVVPVDIRLPFEANRMHLQPDGYRTPFTYLHVLVDSHRDLQENDESNNGAVIARQDILPVDPAAFSTDVTAAAPGALISLAGEGFGPEPGQLVVLVDGRQVQAEIFGWYDLGVNFKLPNIVVGGSTPVELLVVRGDGAVSNPVTISVAPEQMLGAAPLPPSP